MHIGYATRLGQRHYAPNATMTSSTRGWQRATGSLLWEWRRKKEMLNFIIPVRHQDTVADWALVKSCLATTIRSLRAQDNPAWTATVVASRGADLPPCLEGIDVVRVDLEVTRPDSSGPRELFYEAIRHDKGHRFLAGLMHTRRVGHIMVVDYDDLVSRRLATLVADHPQANGWYVDRGYFFSGGRIVYHCRSNFFEWCGTSHIIRADLLRLPKSIDAAPEDYVRRTLGSHKFIKRDLDGLGAPLPPLPFAGAVYRMGHGGSVTASNHVVAQFINRWALHRPGKLAKDILSFRYLGPKLADEFFGGVPG